jgi:hypothetical protein
MMAEVADKASPEAQRMTWDALRKSLNGLVNKVGGCRGARAGEGGGGAGAQEGGREGRRQGRPNRPGVGKVVGGGGMERRGRERKGEMYPARFHVLARLHQAQLPFACPHHAMLVGAQQNNSSGFGLLP